MEEDIKDEIFKLHDLLENIQITQIHSYFLLYNIHSIWYIFNNQPYDLYKQVNILLYSRFKYCFKNHNINLIFKNEGEILDTLFSSNLKKQNYTTFAEFREFQQCLVYQQSQYQNPVNVYKQCQFMKNLEQKFLNIQSKKLDLEIKCNMAHVNLMISNFITCILKIIAPNSDLSLEVKNNEYTDILQSYKIVFKFQLQNYEIIESKMFDQSNNQIMQFFSPNKEIELKQNDQQVEISFNIYKDIQQMLICKYSLEGQEKTDGKLAMQKIKKNISKIQNLNFTEIYPQNDKKKIQKCQENLTLSYQNSSFQGLKTPLKEFNSNNAIKINLNNLNLNQSINSSFYINNTQNQNNNKQKKLQLLTTPKLGPTLYDSQQGEGKYSSHKKGHQRSSYFFGQHVSMSLSQKNQGNNSNSNNFDETNNQTSSNFIKHNFINYNNTQGQQNQDSINDNLKTLFQSDSQYVDKKLKLDINGSDSVSKDQTGNFIEQTAISIESEDFQEMKTVSQINNTQQFNFKK
ncbi:hypothetical protein PPERSA_11215 [Pseudocohnilembus persalinus]|uniref:Uncharacterized protein n=1 Tax=Pseudocohnilembus persalinus TaxID=266149 RepID=A0A0V0QZG2_PSEPJ|nr:hypothetical protein PPERSA_11215 [Pseudocohnilembus persalinus]|eukprot:KRX07666.1 hypothetical protein PPERSA_11215 [Pseudocohnilembus persalinus]